MSDSNLDTYHFQINQQYKGASLEQLLIPRFKTFIYIHEIQIKRDTSCNIYNAIFNGIL